MRACKLWSILILWSGFFVNAAAMSLLLESPAFQNNQFIPDLYTCRGKNISPPLTWRDAPTNTLSYVLTMEDPDAANGTWIHWIVFNIAGTLDHLDDGAIPSNAVSGLNSWNKSGYSGPCPPQGVHRYVFQLYALDTTLSINENATHNELLAAMQGHILEQSDLTGVYEIPLP